MRSTFGSGAAWQFRRVLIALIAMSVAASMAFGQGIVTGSMSGTILDQQKAVVSGAKITARQDGTNVERTTESNAAGLFSITNLPVGTYTVTIDASGFTKTQLAGIQINAAKDTSLGEREMKVGATETVVSVEGTAPLIEPTTSRITTSFESRKITDLPIGNTIDFTVLFTPGAVSQGNASFGNNNGSIASINGQRGRSINYQIDGQANNDNSVTGPALGISNADAVAEYQVITNFSAEYGRNTGGVVNVITKSGTNAFHGTAFEQYRNSVFDSLLHEEKAPAPFGNSGKNPPKFIENHFGATLGGPVLRDKLWFFGAGLGDRLRTAGNTITSVGQITPTPAGMQQLAAQFPNSPGLALLQKIGPVASKLGNPLFPPVTDKAGNITPVSVTDGTKTALIEFGTVSRTVATPQNQQQYIGRFDYQLSGKDRVSGRYIINDAQRPLGSAANTASGYRVDQPSRAHQASLDWTRQFSNTFVNQARMSYTRQHVGFEGGNTGCVENNITNCPTTATFTSNALNLLAIGMANNIPQDRNVNNTQWQDNATWLLGKHNLKVGGEFDRQRSPSTFLPDVNGRYTFSDSTEVIGGVSRNFTAFDNLIRNVPSRFNLADGPTKFNFKEKDAAWYVQDDWRILDNLTVNLGVRWEWTQQAFNLLHDLTVKQQTGPNPFWDPNLPLSRTTVPSLPEDLNNFAPKIGFAYTPRGSRFFGQDKTVIRGGFGISYDEAYYNIFLNTATSAPVVNAGQLTLTTAPKAPGLPSAGNFTGADIRAATLSLIPHGVGQDPGKATWTTVAPNFHNPYVEQWTLGIQRELSNVMAAEIRYVGNHGVGLYRSINGNPALNPFITTGFSNLIPAGLTPCNDKSLPGFAQGYVDCTKTNVFTRINGSSSYYSGLQSDLTIKNWHGLTTFIAYTWSHAIDTVSEVFNANGAAGAGLIAVAPNPFDYYTTERGRSSLDIPNNFAIQFIYDLPFHRDQSGFIGHMLGGWQLNSDYRYNSGEPATVYQAKQTSSLCDATATASTTIDTCRPILNNAAAPFTSVGRITSFSGTGFGSPNVISLGTCDPKATVGSAGCPFVPLSSIHFLVNNLQSAQLLGSPFVGMVSRNTVRGDYISNANLSVFKNTKISERLTMQFQATAYNFMNREFLGVQDTKVTNVSINPNQSTFNNINFNLSGDGSPNVTSSGIGRRRLEFTTKFIF
jgi:outer membrane receptor protein involved in Fe transport